MNHKLSLLICSNRMRVPYSQIWEKIIVQNQVVKVILATQSAANAHISNSKKVFHIKLHTVGRSRAVNSGISRIQAGYVGLTDDDCIIDAGWALQAIHSLQDISIGLVYGQTKPYQPSKHKGQYCPSTFKKYPNVTSVTTLIGRHWVHVGFDNNVAIKKEVFENIGGYKWWLGPGSIIPAAEDAEFILRSQIAGFSIAYNPKMIVYHNKWLSNKDKTKLSDDYSLGGLTAYGYYALQGVVECKIITRQMINYQLFEIRDLIKRICFKRQVNAYYAHRIVKKIYFLIKGGVVAFIFAKIIPIPEKENVVKRFYIKKDL